MRRQLHVWYVIFAPHLWILISIDVMQLFCTKLPAISSHASLVWKLLSTQCHIYSMFGLKCHCIKLDDSGSDHTTNQIGLMPSMQCLKEMRYLRIIVCLSLGAACRCYINSDEVPNQDEIHLWGEACRCYKTFRWSSQSRCSPIYVLKDETR